MKRYAPAFLAALLVTGIAAASAIKSWSSAETVTATDLNANFTHIHNTMVGSHGARLVDADVSSSAAIAHSKMATPALLPKAYAYVGSSCGASPCTLSSSSQVTSITRTGVGAYSVTLAYTPGDANFAVLVAPHTADRHCRSFTHQTAGPQFLISCVENDADGTPQDTNFSLIVMD
jgi:hypothetical protein